MPNLLLEYHTRSKSPLLLSPEETRSAWIGTRANVTEDEDNDEDGAKLAAGTVVGGAITLTTTMAYRPTATPPPGDQMERLDEPQLREVGGLQRRS